MTDKEIDPDVRHIRLLGNDPASALAPREAPSVVMHVGAGMSMDRLVRNYDSILRAGAIYYPVAYQFLRRLGRGRQGVVFLGLRQGARGCITEHAIKVFDPRIYRSPEEYWTDMGRISSQISRLQRVKSPSILSRHSYEETHGIGYVQMDSIDGVDLRRLLQRDHLDTVMRRCTPAEWAKFSSTIFRIERDRVSLQPGVAIYILRDILRGLESLHELNFLHYDVKPGNIMIDRLGYVKVIDFGRAVMAGEELTFLLGSPMYMAPEVHRHEVCRTRADLYSVGLVALEMLRGEPLVSEQASEDELLKLKMTLPERLTGLLPRDVAANDMLVALLRGLLEPDPERRVISAKEADTGDFGLAQVDKQLVQAGLGSEYARDLADYLSKLVDEKTDRVEAGQAEGDVSATRRH